MVTREQKTTDLMNAIGAEIDEYGVPSLLEVIASVVEGYASRDETPSAERRYWERVRIKVSRLADEIADLRRTDGR